MKRLFLIVALLGFGWQMVAAQDANCDPTAVKEWMIQRQIGRNEIEPILDGTSTDLTDALLLVQRVRREFEDLPRPACADELYELTIYFYNAVGDLLGFGLNNDVQSVTDVIGPRFQRYADNVNALYDPLQAIAGVDVMAEAAARGSIAPTPAPTLSPLQFQGDKGNVVVGPADVPAGVYKLTLTGTPGTAINISSVSGNCSDYTFVAPDSTASESVLRSDGCSILIEVSPNASAWTLVLQPIG